MVCNVLPFRMSNDITSCLTILERLVGFDTTSQKSNAALIHWVKDYLASLGVEARLQQDESGEKFNLLATIGDRSKPGIVLSGHTDVVPADPAHWLSDPFTLRQENGRMFGRGTTDMKGFLSVVLAAVPRMLERSLTCPVTLAFTYDEEVGCFGAQALAEKDDLPMGQHVIVGEPTSLRRGTCHKGARIQTLRIKGVPAHSGTPDLGLNAIEYSQSVMAQLIELGRTLARCDKSFCSTLVVTGVDGGGAANVVPSQCDVTWLFRPADEEDANRVEQEILTLTAVLDHQLKGLAVDAGASLDTVCDVPLFRSDAPELMAGRLGGLFRNRAVAELDFATEAGVYHNAGHSVVVCGPGDMAQGHTHNEFIQLSALQDGIRFIDEVIDAARS